MLLGEMGRLAAALEKSPVGSDPIWRKPVDAVSEMDIQLFYARASVSGHRQAAVEIMDQAQAVAIAVAFDGHQVAPALILHSPPEHPYMIDEFMDGLMRLKGHRRLACLFALESGEGLESAALLRWAQVKPQHRTGVTGHVLAMADRSRHIRLPYVFWEWATEHIAAPLLELTWSVENAFERPWPALARRYRDMVWVSQRAERVSFEQVIGQLDKP